MAGDMAEYYDERVDQDFDVEDRADKLWEQYQGAKRAFTGALIACACCGKRIRKRSYQHVFCSNKGRGNCKDTFWNTVDERRRERARWEPTST